jgi:hypothetical protein
VKSEFKERIHLYRRSLILCSLILHVCREASVSIRSSDRTIGAP